MTTQKPPALPPLPELSDARIDELEEALFAGIARESTLDAGRERQAQQKRMRRRRRVWWGTAAAAAVVVAAVAIGPVLGNLGLTAGGGGSAARDEGAATAPQPAENGLVVDSGRAADGGDLSGAGSSLADREIIATAQAAVRVDDVAGSAQAIGEAAQKRGGYVESMNVGEERSGAVDGRGVVDETMPFPISGAWITVRVPADELTGAIDELSALGTVESSSITRQDVTEQAVDLRARIGALEASVERLTVLMGKAGSVGDLIAAETALSERQAELESYQAQLTSLESQVSLSSLTVSLMARTAVVKADPAGFADGLAAGWNGLVATLNGIVIGLGFLLPWIVVAGVIALIAWWIVRARRRRREAPATEAADEA